MLISAARRRVASLAALTLTLAFGPETTAAVIDIRTMNVDADADANTDANDDCAGSVATVSDVVFDDVAGLCGYLWFCQS